MDSKFIFDRERYFSFHKGVPIRDGEINEWIEKAMDHAAKQFKNHPEIKQSFGSISSGNTKVIVEMYKQGNGNYTVNVSVCDGYWKACECDVEVN